MSFFIRCLAHVTLVMAIALAMVATFIEVAGFGYLINERAVYIWLGLILMSGSCYWILIMLAIRRPGIKPRPVTKRQVKEVPQDGAYYALQYPDGSYAWESNCQGWGSTPVKPKIGDGWCFDAQHAIWNLRDLKDCTLVRITERKEKP